MFLTKIELLEGEVVLIKKGASLIVDPNQHGLKPLRDSMSINTISGISGKEKIGGVLTVTNYRVVFSSHYFNRVKGTVSIYLPSIVDVAENSSFLTPRVLISTRTLNFDFNIWGVDKFISTLNDAMSRSSNDKVTAFVKLNAAALVEDLMKKGSFGKFLPEMESDGERALTMLSSSIKFISNPLDISNCVCLLDIVNAIPEPDKEPQL